MANISLREKRTVIYLTLYIAMFVLMCYPRPVQANVSLTLTGGNWVIGALKSSTETNTTGDTWTITNDSGGYEYFEISVVVTNGTWVARTIDDNANANNEFILREDTSAGKLITGTNTILIASIADTGTYPFDLWFKAPPIGSTEETETLTVTVTATNWSSTSSWTCGDNLVITHTAGTPNAEGNVAPVTKVVAYETVETALTGASKCWITQNLGASQQAVSVTDDTEVSGGWYWQFNREQGYKLDDDDVTRTPSVWDSSEDGTACDPVVAGTAWCPANDPCTIELGAGWRLPTSAEWTNADGVSGGNWDNYTDTYNSVLKIHAAGYLFSDGSLYNRGEDGIYWSSTEKNSDYADYLSIDSESSYMNDYLSKSRGFSVRCLKDEAEWACGDNLAITHTAGTPNAEGNVAPVTKSVTYGTVETALTGESKCWITQNLGATDQASSATDSDEDSAGWYWQFNLEQGYKHDGTTLTPSWTIGSIDNDSDWIAANDPCTIELGAGWRLPTSAEWTNADGASGGNWDNYTDTYNSVLKIHAAGYLISDGLLYYRGSDGLYWSSAQFSSTAGYFLFFDSTDSYLEYFNKAYGYSVRCLKE